MKKFFEKNFLNFFSARKIFFRLWANYVPQNTEIQVPKGFMKRLLKCASHSVASHLLRRPNPYGMSRILRRPNPYGMSRLSRPNHKVMSRLSRPNHKVMSRILLHPSHVAMNRSLLRPNHTKFFSQKNQKKWKKIGKGPWKKVFWIFPDFFSFFREVFPKKILKKFLKMVLKFFF